MGYDGGGGSSPQSPGTTLTTRKNRIPIVTFVTLKKLRLSTSRQNRHLQSQLQFAWFGRARERAECAKKLKQQQKWAKVQEVPPPGNLVLQGESSYKSLFQ